MKTTEKAKAKAKEFSLFVKNDVPETHTRTQILNGQEWSYKDKLNEVYTLPSEELNKFKHDLFFNCRNQYKNHSKEVELYYIERSEIIFETPEGNLTTLRKYKNKYTFALYHKYYNDVHKIEYSIREKAYKESGLKEPQKIGVFTEKKIKNWLEYCDKLIKFNENLVKEHNSKNDELMIEVNEFIRKSNGQVSKYNNIIDVDLKNFSVRFIIYKDQNYISKKITFKGGLNTVLELI